MVVTGSPHANEQVERVNLVVVPIISKLVSEENAKVWNKVLPEIEFALSNSVSKATREIASNLLLETDQRWKIVDNIKEFLVENVHDSNRDLVTLRSQAADKIDKNQNYSKSNYDKKHVEAQKYEPDDYVMIRNFDVTPGISHKLIPRFKGSYRILKTLKKRYIVADRKVFKRRKGLIKAFGRLQTCVCGKDYRNPQLIYLRRPRTA